MYYFINQSVHIECTWLCLSEGMGTNFRFIHLTHWKKKSQCRYSMLGLKTIRNENKREEDPMCFPPIVIYHHLQSQGCIVWLKSTRRTNNTWKYPIYLKDILKAFAYGFDDDSREQNSLYDEINAVEIQ